MAISHAATDGRLCKRATLAILGALLTLSAGLPATAQDAGKDKKEEDWDDALFRDRSIDSDLPPVCRRTSGNPFPPGWCAKFYGRSRTLPAILTREMIKQTLADNLEAIRKCADELETKKTIWIRFKVFPSGSTWSVEVAKGNPPRTASVCVINVVKRLQFPKTKRGSKNSDQDSFTYPFVLDPPEAKTNNSNGEGKEATE